MPEGMPDGIPDGGVPPPPPPPGAPPPPPPVESDSAPEYRPAASQCQISTTAFGTAAQLSLSWTRIASRSRLPGRSSRISLRILSASK